MKRILAAMVIFSIVFSAILLNQAYAGEKSGSCEVGGMLYSKDKSFVMIGEGTYQLGDSVCEGEIASISVDRVKVKFSGEEKEFKVGDTIRSNVSSEEEKKEVLSVFRDDPALPQASTIVQKTESPSVDQADIYKPTSFLENSYGEEKAVLQKLISTIGLGWFLILTLVAIILIYIYPAICLQFMAKKAEVGPGWWAWFPILEFILKLKIASLSYWWMLIVLVVFIPVIGSFTILGFTIFLWYRIILALSESRSSGIAALMAVLFMLPFINLIVMSKLAFSKE